MQFLHVLHPVSAGTVTGMNINPPLNFLDWHKKRLGEQTWLFGTVFVPQAGKDSSKAVQGVQPLVRSESDASRFNIQR